MRITVTVQDDTGQTVATEEVNNPMGVAVVMVKPVSGGGAAIDYFEPLETDTHPDTLRQIGGRIADFAN